MHNCSNKGTLFASALYIEFKKSKKFKFVLILLSNLDNSEKQIKYFIFVGVLFK